MSHLVLYSGHLVVTAVYEAALDSSVHAVMADADKSHITKQGFGTPVSAAGQGVKEAQASSSCNCSSLVVVNLPTLVYFYKNCWCKHGDACHFLWIMKLLWWCVLWPCITSLYSFFEFKNDLGPYLMKSKDSKDPKNI